jgi:hypothetical protein
MTLATGYDAFLEEICLWSLELECLFVFLGGYSTTMSGLDKKIDTHQIPQDENQKFPYTLSFYQLSQSTPNNPTQTYQTL